MKKIFLVLLTSVAVLFGLTLQASRVTTYTDGLNAHIIPYIETVKIFGFGDTFTIRQLDVDSVPQGTSGRKLDGDPQRDSAIFLTYVTIPSFIRDSAQIDSFYSAWGITATVPYLAFVPKDPPPPAPDTTYPNEPAGMTEMYASNINFSDQAGPDNFSFVDHIIFDDYGWKRQTSTFPPFLQVDDPRNLGFPLPPSGSDTVLIGKWAEGFSTGNAPFGITYSRSWAGNSPRKSMYWSVWMFIDPTFIWHPGTTKGFWMSQDQNNNHFVYLSRNLDSQFFGLFTQFNDGPPDGVEGANNQYPGLFKSSIPVGVWFRVEWLFVANSANAVKDGIYRMYFDGIEQTAVAVDTLYYFDSADNNKAFSVIKWAPTWGGGSDVDVDHDQYILLDDFYASWSSNRVSPL